MNNEKPTDVSELEWRIGRFVRRCCEFIALCAAMIALQAFLTVFNPANPTDKEVTVKRDKAVYLACVNASRKLHGYEWNMAVKACAQRYHEGSKRMVDYP